MLDILAHFTLFATDKKKRRLKIGALPGDAKRIEVMQTIASHLSYHLGQIGVLRTEKGRLSLRQALYRARQG